MPCPAPPGYFDLAAPHYMNMFWFIAVAFTSLWLLALAFVPLNLRREAKRLPPGPARRPFLLLRGTSMLLPLVGTTVMYSSILWQSAITAWSASLPIGCRTPAVEAFQDRASLIGFVPLGIWLLLFASGSVLREIARQRKRRLVEAAAA